MSIASQLALAQQYMTRYGMTTYVVLGNIGLLFNIVIFTHQQYRRNPCSLYLLAASVCAFLGLNISAIPVIYQLDYVSAILTSQLYCQLQFYARQALNIIFRFFFLFACADRFAISSENARIRSFSQYKIAIYIIPSVIVFWLLMSIFPTILRVAENGKCDARIGTDALIYSIYILAVVGIFPVGSAIIFSMLIGYNLKKIRSRVQPMISTGHPPTNHGLRKRDRDMLRMLLVDIICYAVTSIPTVAMLLYAAITQTTVKSDHQQRVESFARYVTGTFLLFASNSMSFWIYICASKSFRLEVKRLIIKCYRFIKREQASINEIT